MRVKEIFCRIRENIFSSFLNLRLEHVAFLLFSIGYGGLFVRSLYRCLTPDEYEGIHTGWKILKGQEIYVDFFQHHNPLTFYIWAFLINIFGNNFIVMRIARFIQFLFFSGTLFFSWRIVILLYGKKIAWIFLPLLLSFTFFTPCAIDIRPDIAALFFLMSAFYLLFLFMRDHAWYQLIISGFLVSLSFLCIQKIALFIPLFIFLTLYAWYYKRFSLFYTVICALLGSIPVMIYFFYLWYNNFLFDYYVCNVVFNTTIAGKANPLVMFLDSLKENAFQWTLFIIGSLQIFFKKNCSMSMVPVVAWYGLCTMASLRVAFEHYYMPSSLFVCVIAAYAFLNMFHKLSEWQASLLLVGLTSGQLIRPYTCWYKKEILVDKHRIERFHTLIPEAACVFTRRPLLNLFRDDIDYLWFTPVSADIFFKKYDKNYDLIQLIKDKKPAALYEIDTIFLQQIHTLLYRQHDDIAQLYLLQENTKG